MVFAQRQSSKLLPTSGNSSSCDRRLYYTYIIHIYIYNITCAVTTDIEVYGCDQHFQWSPADHSKRLSPNFSNAGCHLPQKMYAIYFECNSTLILEEWYLFSVGNLLLIIGLFYLRDSNFWVLPSYWPKGHINLPCLSHIKFCNEQSEAVIQSD